MRFRFTLQRPTTSINAIASWEDLGEGAAAWSGGSVTLGSFQTSNILADDIINPYKGAYNFTITASGTVNGGAGNTAQLTFLFLDKDENIIESSDAINIPNAGLSNHAVEVDAEFGIPFFIAIKVNNLTTSSNDITVAITYTAPDDEVVISEPDGWDGAKIKWERHPEFFSIVEQFEGSANGAFIFYGKNEAEGIDGGIQFIRDAEAAFGFDVDLGMLIEYSDDDISYETLFEGLLDLSQKVEMKDNRMQVPVVPDDIWTKFQTRLETPVDVTGTTDIDGNDVSAIPAITVKLPSQTIRKTHYAVEADRGIAVTIDLNSTDLFIQYTPGDFELDEMEDFYHLTPFNNLNLPVSTFDVKEEGTYSFDIQWTMSAIFGATENHVNNLDGIFLKVNDEDPIEFSFSDETSGSVDFTVFSLQTTLYLLAGDAVRIYGKATDSSQTITYGFWGKNGLVHGPLDNPTYSQERPAGMDEIPTYTRVTADTTYPETEAQGYLIHDLLDGIVQRMGLPGIYSEFLGSTLTNSRQYDDDGCGWMYVIIKGLQLRGYSLSEKPFFASFRQIWDGINPILNLGLGYEEVSSTQVIRIEPKSHFIGSTAQINFSNVREISAQYDESMIFKTIRMGYKKWQAEDISGIDDPQTKHVYATRFEKAGTDLMLESDFIAASLAIETTRRKTREKSADYKFDNDNFIISLNTNDVSPDTYEPERDENFSSITDLLHSDTRYNSVLTPKRNLLRWGEYLSGCLQDYLNSAFRFVSGEGNYDMASTSTDSCERGVISENIAENDHVNLAYLKLPEATYQARFGYFFLPLLHDISIPMEKSDFDQLDRKQPIAISQTESGHINFHIKEMEYEVLKGEAIIKAWPESAFNITVPEQTINTRTCE